MKNTLKRVLATGAVGAVVAGASLFGAAGSASAEPTGVYTYTCTGVSGVSYTWAESNLQNCDGWVDSYITGNHVAHVHMVPPVYKGTARELECSWQATTTLLSFVGLAEPAGWFVTGYELTRMGLVCNRNA